MRSDALGRAAQARVRRFNDEVPDAPGVTLRYGNSRPLPVGRGMPKQIDDVYRKISELAASMPQVPADALKPIDLSSDPNGAIAKLVGGSSGN